jgi:mono/diheme cytochrome c family protein
MLAGALARSRDTAALTSLLDQAGATGRPLGQRRALLRGLDAGLTGDEGGVPKLPTSPRSLTDMTAQPAEIGALARAVAAKLDWPGKPVARLEVPPLTADEKVRFETGRKLYGNLCLSCHGPDGRGRERQAPSLVGSPLLVGDAGVPTRVMLAGKEGDMGLMPPLAALTDDEIASVLTYVRREWGNTASAVAPDAVKEIRGLTKLRTRPWSAEELRAVPR